MALKLKARVLIVTDMHGHDDEGMKKIARKLTESFIRRGMISACTVSSRGSKKYLHDSHIVHYIGGPSFRSVLFLAWCKFINRKIITILTFSNPQWNWLGDLAVMLFPPDALIVSSRIWYQWAKKKKLRAMLMCVSGVDPDVFTLVSEKEKRNIRAKLHLPAHKILVLHVGHIKPNRNLGVFKQLQASDEIQVIIIGSTTTVQSEEIIELLEQAGCIFVRDYLPAIERYYQAVDCYVFPTVDQRAAVQIPLSILEASACGLPVITSKFGGLYDFFSEADSFRFISPDKFDKLEEIIRNHIKNANHPPAIVGELSWEKISDKLEDIYHQLMS